MMPIASIIATAKTVYDAAGKAIEVSEKLTAAEAQLKVVELAKQLQSIVTENMRLHQELEAAKASLHLKHTLHFADGMYWKDETKTGSPYCPHCYLGKDKLCPMNCCSDGYFEYALCHKPIPDPLHSHSGMPSSFAAYWTDDD